MEVHHLYLEAGEFPVILELAASAQPNVNCAGSLPHSFNQISVMQQPSLFTSSHHGLRQRMEGADEKNVIMMARTTFRMTALNNEEVMM